MMENNNLLIKKVHIKTQSKKLFITGNDNDSNLLHLTKTALKRTSKVIFNMKKVDLDES